jgi:hypothetical protein
MMERIRMFRAAFADPLGRHQGWLVWAMVIQAVILIPLLLLAQGYLPVDDCLRHAAKAVDGRPWTEILVLRPGILVDPHAPWHAVLRSIHLVAGLGPEGLVSLTVAGLFILVLLAPLPWLKAPDAWILAWVLAWALGGSQIRLLLGRPFEIPMAACLAVMALWRGGARGPSAWFLATAFFGVAAALHGAWYLLLMVPAAHLAAGRWRDAANLTAAWAAGCGLAALATGHPVTFLVGQLVHLGHALGPSAPPAALVPELQSSRGGGLVGVALLGILVLQVTRGREARLLRDPLFLLALGGWLLGLVLKRFWVDWGYPCLVLWVAFQIAPHLARLGRRAPGRRLVLALGAGAAATFILSTADEGRWSDRSRQVSFAEARPDLRDWLPGEGGILYAPDMSVFFDTYYRLPHARWRYMVGFEPAMMPPEDVATYHRILLDPYNPDSFKPWVDKMRPQDRLLLTATRSPANVVPGLEWVWFQRTTWVGRKPKVQ